MAETLIDTIFRGIPIPPLTCLLATDKEHTGRRWWIIDGQQRLEAILRFIDNEFPTAKELVGERGLKPLYPNLYYRQLPDDARDKFDRYLLRFDRISGVDVEMTGMAYRRLNNRVGLTPAEKFFSYDTRTKQIAEATLLHPVWDRVYHGNRQRKQLFAMALMVLTLEVRGIFGNVTASSLTSIITADSRAEIDDPELPKKLRGGLTAIEHLFDGVVIRSTIEVVPLYQAVRLLENAGYSLQRSERGCLTSWYMALRQTALEARKRGERDRLNMSMVGAQMEFWRVERETLFDVSGLVLLDARRRFAEHERLGAWLSQNRLCPVCQGELRFIDAVAHHKVPYALGGQTRVSNCIVAHVKCHEGLHLAAAS